MKDTSNYNYNTLKQLISSCNVTVYIVLMKLTLIDCFKATYFSYKKLAVMRKEGNEITINTQYLQTSEYNKDYTILVK